MNSDTVSFMSHVNIYEANRKKAPVNKVLLKTVPFNLDFSNGLFALGAQFKRHILAVDVNGLFL